MTETPIQQARDLLADIKRQAEDGTLDPAHVPEQIDTVTGLLAQIDSPDALAKERVMHSEFLSTTVHEMRIPLTSVRGYADMLAQKMPGDLNDQQAQFVATILANARHLERLIADVNDIGKIRGGRLFVDRKTESAANILAAAAKQAADLAAERDITLVFDVPDGLPLLNVDGARMIQALGYLIENALHYSPEGGTVTVSASREANHLRVTVQDTGVGMDADELAHLGEPFWRSDDERVRSVKGHGLGCAVARGIIEAHGGQMQITSVPEQGSTFSFTLPAAEPSG